MYTNYTLDSNINELKQYYEHISMSHFVQNRLLQAIKKSLDVRALQNR